MTERIKMYHNIILLTLLCVLILNKSFFNLLYNIRMELKFNKQNKRLENMFCKKCFAPLEIPKRKYIENKFYHNIVKRYYEKEFKCTQCNNKQKLIIKYNGIKGN